MNSKGITPLTNRNICMKCQQKEATKFYEIHNRGYGSDFDSMDTTFQCCDDCDNVEYVYWFNEVAIEKDYYEEYKYEENIHKLINSIPLNSQELFENYLSEGACAGFMDSQDWIDYELDELPHEKCKEYGMRSPQEISAYHDRFPTCDKVEKKVYNDGSSSCWCPYDAHGNSDGTCSSNSSEECYMCTHYNRKSEDFEMRVIDIDQEEIDRETERLQEMIEYATNKLNEIKNKEEN